MGLKKKRFVGFVEQSKWIKQNKVEEKRPKKNGKLQKTTETKATRQNMKGLRKG